MLRKYLSNRIAKGIQQYCFSQRLYSLYFAIYVEKQKNDNQTNSKSKGGKQSKSEEKKKKKKKKKTPTSAVPETSMDTWYKDNGTCKNLYYRGWFSNLKEVMFADHFIKERFKRD